jgi:hypothetical protein
MRFAILAITLPFIVGSVVGFPPLHLRSSAHPYCSPNENNACNPYTNQPCFHDDTTRRPSTGEWSYMTCCQRCRNDANGKHSCCIGGNRIQRIGLPDWRQLNKALGAHHVRRHRVETSQQQSPAKGSSFPLCHRKWISNFNLLPLAYDAWQLQQGETG